MTDEFVLLCVLVATNLAKDVVLLLKTTKCFSVICLSIAETNEQTTNIIFPDSRQESCTKKKKTDAIKLMAPEKKDEQLDYDAVFFERKTKQNQVGSSAEVTHRGGFHQLDAAVIAPQRRRLCLTFSSEGSCPPDITLSLNS